MTMTSALRGGGRTLRRPRPISNTSPMHRPESYWLGPSISQKSIVVSALIFLLSTSNAYVLRPTSTTSCGARTCRPPLSWQTAPSFARACLHMSIQEPEKGEGTTSERTGHHQPQKSKETNNRRHASTNHKKSGPGISGGKRSATRKKKQRRSDSSRRPPAKTTRHRPIRTTSPTQRFNQRIDSMGR